MSNIDERIVYMKFDNDHFEAGIKTTLTSLENLKKNLNFNSSIRNLADLDAASKSTNLKMDPKGFTDGAKATADAAAKLQKDVNLGPIQQKIQDLQRTGDNFRLRFNATEFGSGVQTAVTKIQDFKKHFNFDAALQALSNVSIAGRNFNLEGMASGIDKIASKFQNLQVVGITAIATLTTKAVDAGLQLAKSAFIDNPKAGLEEYETNLNSIQTILANTAHQGTNLKQVEGALENLNAYSDKTIYNFSEMARNIGTFTAAGVDLDTSTNAIKGIANIAAVSGSTSEQASTAMYQLSQALSTGKVSLMDWNSVVNAGMGGKVFQDAILETARNQGIAVDGIIKKNGSFRDSLQEGWLTSKVLTETLSKFTGDLTDDQLKSMGYTQDQIANIQKMAVTAQDAATKIKTFSQLTGTLQETTGSGWAKTWQIVLGDFEEAKVLFTDVNNVIGGMVSASADARNKMLGDWKALGGRSVAIEAVSNAFKALMGIVTPIKNAFRDVFPATTGQKLYDITVKIRDFTAALIPGEKTTKNIHTAFTVLFSIIKFGMQIIGGFIKVIATIFKLLFDGGKTASDAASGFGDFVKRIVDFVDDSNAIPHFFAAICNAIRAVGPAISSAIGFIVMMGTAVAAGFGGFINGGLEVGLTRVRERIESFGKLGEIIIRIWDRVKGAAERAWQALEPLRTAVQKMFTDIGQNIKEVFTDVNFDQALDLVNTGLFAGLILLFRNFFKKTLGMGDGLKEGLLDKLGGTMEGVVDALDGVTGVLKAMQTNLQADTLMKIAIAIGVLTASVVVLSLIDSGKLTQALLAMTVMFTQLGIAMKIFEGVSSGPGVLRLPVLAAGMILLGIAILVLASAVKKLAKMEWGDLIKGLTGVMVLLAGVSLAAKVMGPSAGNLIATGIGMVAIAIAIRILAGAVKEFAEISWPDMIKGLVGVGATLAALVIFSQLVQVNKGAVASGVGLILLGTAIKILASAVSDFAAMDTGKLMQGMVALGAVMIMMTSFTGATSNMTGIFKAAVGLVVMGAALKIIASALGDFGAFDVGTLIKGLVGLGVALAAITLAMMLMPPNMPAIAIGLIGVGVALKLIASAVGDMGGMSWDEIGRGLTVLAASLILIAAATLVMTTALPGAAAMLVVAAAMAVLAPVLTIFGNFSWEQLGMAMAMLAGVFILFGLAGLLLAPLTPVLMGLGIAIGLVGIGLMAAGVGVLAFATGLILLATIGSATVPIIVGLVTQILGLIPTALRMVGEGIVEFAKVIGDNIPVFVTAMVKLLMGLLEAINTVSGPIIDTLMSLIGKLLQALLDNVPNFLVMGIKLIVALLQGIADNIDDVVIAAVDIVIALLNGIANRLPDLITAGVNVVVAFLDGIGKNTKTLADAGFKLVIDFMNGIANSIRENSGKMREAGGNIGSAIIEGITGGIGDGINSVVNAAKGVADSAINAAKDLLNINSPSRVFRDEVGAQIPAGMALGITAKGHLVEKAVEGVGDNAISTLKRSMAAISTLSTIDMDMSPTIRPVLDLSSVGKEAGKLGSMLKSPTLNVSGNYAKATSLLEREAANRAQAEANLQNESESTASNERPAVQLVQNNYSPKSLSSAEIYRNTNNQLSAAKGALTNVE